MARAMGAFLSLSAVFSGAGGGAWRCAGVFRGAGSLFCVVYFGFAASPAWAAASAHWRGVRRGVVVGGGGGTAAEFAALPSPVALSLCHGAVVGAQLILMAMSPIPGYDS